MKRIAIQNASDIRDAVAELDAAASAGQADSSPNVSKAWRAQPGAADQRLDGRSVFIVNFPVSRP